MTATVSVPEQLDSDGASTGVEREVPDEPTDSVDLEIVQPYDPDLIDVVTRTPTVDLLISRLRHSRIDLSPDFQRKAGIWTDVAQSRLIESLLLRIPLPTLYASEDEDERWLIVDGIQRLTSIARFVEASAIGAIPLKLQQLEYLKQYEGFSFEKLPGRLQTRIRETELVLHLIRLGTPDEVKYNIFARINTGGLPLSAQELRHALIPGSARDILRDLAQSEEFLDATTRSVKDDRMADREMVLRFFAFYLTDPSDYSSQDFDQFLRLAMVRLNKLSKTSCEASAEQFVRAMKAAHRIFGAHAFRKVYQYGDSRFPINKALFETIAVNLARLDDRAVESLIESPDDVMAAYRMLMKDLLFINAISQGTGDPRKVRYRFATVARFFKELSPK